MGIVKQRSGGGDRSTASIAVAGLALVQAFDCTILAVLSAKWPSRLWTVSPSAGRSATRR